MPTELKLPDVGDNIEKGNVVTVLIQPGDSVQEGQPIIEIETDKAVVEVPASASGTVENVNVKVGDTIQVGGVIATLGGAGQSNAAQGDAGQSAGAASKSAGGGNQENLVDSADVAPNAQTAERVAQAQQEQQKAQAGKADGGNASAAAYASAPAAASAAQVTLPDVGDNIEKGTVVTVMVNVGDTVQEGQPVIELETDKAVVEVPANASGTVQSVNVKVGDSVKVGGVLLTLSGGAASAPAAQASASSGSAQAAQGGGDKAATVESSPTAPDPGTANKVAQGQQEAQKESAQKAQGGQPQGAPQAQAASPQQSGTQNPQTFDGRDLVPAAPSVRRLAREMNVDIHAVRGTGIAGRISEEDVRRTAGTPSVQPAAAAAGAAKASVMTTLKSVAFNALTSLAINAAMSVFSPTVGAAARTVEFVIDPDGPIPFAAGHIGVPGAMVVLHVLGATLVIITNALLWGESRYRARQERTAAPAPAGERGVPA